MEHTDDCPCHNCTANRLQAVLIEEWHDKFIAPLTVDMRFQFNIASNSDQHCNCGKPLMADAVEGALIDSIVGLIGSVVLDGHNQLVAPAAVVVMGKVIERFGYWLADQGVEPIQVEEPGLAEVPGQNAPTTQVPQ